MAQIIEVSFKGNRRAYYAAEAEDIQLNDYVIVEADRGEDLGRVTAAGAVAERKCSGCSTGCAAPVPEQRVTRRAKQDEVDRAVGLRADEPRIRRVTREKVAQYGLKNTTGAIAALQKAITFDETRKQAGEWLRHLSQSPAATTASTS